MFWAEIWKISEFYLKTFSFLVVKFSLHLNSLVFFMCATSKRTGERFILQCILRNMSSPHPIFVNFKRKSPFHCVLYNRIYKTYFVPLRLTFNMIPYWLLVRVKTDTSITKTRLYNIDPLKPHFYVVKLGFTGVYIIFLISAKKHRLWVLVRTASSRF